MKSNKVILLVMLFLTILLYFCISYVDIVYALGPEYLETNELVIFDANHWSAASVDYVKTSTSIVMGQSMYSDAHYSAFYDVGSIELVEDNLSGNYVTFSTNGWWNSTPTIRYGAHDGAGVNIEGVSYIYMTIKLDAENLKKFKEVGAYSKNVIGSESSTYDGNKALVLAVGEDSGVTYSTWIKALNNVTPNEWITLELPITNGIGCFPTKTMSIFNFFFGKPLSATMSIKQIVFSKVKRESNKVTVLFDAEHWNSLANNFTKTDTSITMGSSIYTDSNYSAFYDTGSVELVEDKVAGNYVKFSTNNWWDSTPTLRYGAHGGSGVNIENISYVYMTLKFDEDNLNKFKTIGAYSKNVIGSESSTYDGNKALVLAVGEDSGVTYTTWINALKNVVPDKWITLELPITNGTGAFPNQTIKNLTFFFGKPLEASMSLKNIYVSQKRIIPEKIISIFDAEHWTSTAKDYKKTNTSITMGSSVHADADYSAFYDTKFVELKKDSAGNYITFTTDNWWNATPTLRYGAHDGDGVNIEDISYVYMTLKVDEKNLKKFYNVNAYSKNVIGSESSSYDGDKALVLSLGDDSGITYTTWINSLKNVVPDEWITLELPVTNGVDSSPSKKKNNFEFFFGQPLEATMSLKRIVFTNKKWVSYQTDIKLPSSSYLNDDQSDFPTIINTEPTSIGLSYKYIKMDFKCSDVSKLLKNLNYNDNELALYLSGIGFEVGSESAVGVKNAVLKTLLMKNRENLEAGKTVTFLLPLSNGNKFDSFSVITGINLKLSLEDAKTIDISNVVLMNTDGNKRVDYLDDATDDFDDVIKNPVTKSNVLEFVIILFSILIAIKSVQKSFYNNRN